MSWRRCVEQPRHERRTRLAHRRVRQRRSPYPRPPGPPRPRGPRLRSGDPDQPQGAGHGPLNPYRDLPPITGETAVAPIDNYGRHKVDHLDFLRHQAGVSRHVLRLLSPLISRKLSGSSPYFGRGLKPDPPPWRMYSARPLASTPPTRPARGASLRPREARPWMIRRGAPQVPSLHRRRRSAAPRYR